MLPVREVGAFTCDCLLYAYGVLGYAHMDWLMALDALEYAVNTCARRGESSTCGESLGLII